MVPALMEPRRADPVPGPVRYESPSRVTRANPPTPIRGVAFQVDATFHAPRWPLRSCARTRNAYPYPWRPRNTSAVALVPVRHAFQRPPLMDTWTSYEATPLTSLPAQRTTKPSSPRTGANALTPVVGADASTRGVSASARYSSPWPPS